jgi:hypothetical protein
MCDQVWPVPGCGKSGRGQLVMKADRFGRVVDSVVVDAGVVWEIDWADGSKDLWLHVESG